MLWANPDAPLFTSGDIFRGRWATSFTARDGHLFSYVLNNYWHTNTPPSQSGTGRFRYAFWPTGAWDEGAASIRVRDFREPGLVNEIVIQDFTTPRAPVLPTKGSLLDVALDDDLEATVLVARAATGVLVRMASLSASGGTGSIGHPRGSSGRAWLCNAVEDQIDELPVDQAGRVQISVSGHEVKTLLLA